MNEPSNFVDGSENACTTEEEAGYELDHPPYTPAVSGGSLYHNTLCPSALHAIGTHFDLHNLYSHFETVVTHKCVRVWRTVHTPLVYSHVLYMH